MMRYITKLSVLLLVLLSCSSALAGPRYVRMVVGTREVSLSPRAVLEDGAVYAPTDVLKSLGANFVEGKRKVSIVLGDDTQELDLSDRNGSRMVSMNDVAKLLDLERAWSESTSTLTLLGKLVSVDFEGSTLTAKTTVPVSVSQTRLWSEPWRLSIDLAGAKIATEAKAFNVGDADVSQVRVGQFEDTTARIVIDLNGKRGYRVLTNGPSREIKLVIGDGPKGAPSPSTPLRVARAEASDTKPVQPAPTVKPEPKPVSITEIVAEPSGDAAMVVRVKTTGCSAFHTSMLDAPPRAVIDVENATLDMSDSDIDVDHPLLTTIRVAKREDGSVRLVLESPGYPVFFAEPDGNDILLKLRQPSSAGGKLSDKIVVIDPGHGGKDPGARGGGVKEKDIALMLAEAVKSALEEAGASVIMTRQDDTFIELPARPAVADSCGGDFFISIHCNALVPEKKWGTDIYYHTGQDSSRALAMAILPRLISRTGMKNNGVRKDTSLGYKSGLSVLRNANVPAILIESGYIDCTRDRDQLCDPSWREKFARGVVDGLRVYVEGTMTVEDN